MNKKKAIIIISEIFSISLILLGFLFFSIFTKLEWNITLVAVISSIYLVNAIITLHLFFERRTLESKLSWFLFVTIVPIFGPFIYLVFGIIKKNNSIPKKEYEKEMDLYFQENENTEDLSILDDEIMKKISIISSRNIIKTNTEFLSKGYIAFNKIFEDLKNAKKFIFIEMYIVKPSENYEELVNILLQKANEGVIIKLIIDDFGRWSLTDNELKYLNNHKNISVKSFSRIRFPFVNGSDTFRLHRKFFVIDGKIVHGGGINISDEYSSFDKKYGFWEDLNYRITSEKFANDLTKLFLFDWKKYKKETLNKNDFLNNNPIEKNDEIKNLISIEDGPNIDDEIIYSIIQILLFSAKKSITICTPYFIPNKELYEILKSIALTGIDITIYIPGRPDKKSLYVGTKYYLNKLRKYGIKTKIINNIFLHSKLILIDDKYSFFGSVNFDMRSLFCNYEIANISNDENIIKDLKKIVSEYETFSHDFVEVEEGKLHKFFKALFVLLFTPLF
ncbi:MAG: phospholipase D-like domain-containing protein [Metamycoplasmataceae bacterium]